MSFLKNAWRESKLVKQYGYTAFGTYKRKRNSPADADKDYEFSHLPAGNSYESNKKLTLSQGKSQHFYKAMDKLLNKLAQAELHGDFGPYGKNVRPFDYESSDDFTKELGGFATSRSKIYEQLNTFKRTDKQAIETWFKDNQELMFNFLVELDVIYKLRTPWAKYLKDPLWELADALLIVLAAVSLAAIVIHLAGVGIFAGAFAHLVSPVVAVAPAAVTTTMLEGATAATTLAFTGLFKVVYSEKREIKAAIEKDLKTTITRPVVAA